MKPPPPTPTALLLNPRGEAVRAARAVGARTLVVGPDLAAPGMRRTLAEADEAVECDWSDTRRLLNVLRPFSGMPQTSVFGFDAASALHASYANAILRLPGNPPGVLRALTEPAALRELANRYTPYPVRAERCDAAGLVDAARRTGFPCVVRPSTGRARLLHTPADAEALAVPFAAAPETGPLLVEECLDGPAYDVCAHSYGGAHTVHSVAPAGRSAACGGPGGDPCAAPGGTDGLPEVPAPAGLRPDVLRAVRRLVTVTLEAVDHQVGLTHATVVQTAQGPRLLAAGPGPVPGAECSLYELAVTAVLGLPRPAHQAAVG